MTYKYIILKTSWGIVIFLDVREIINPSLCDGDLKVNDRIYLRINPDLKLPNELVDYWIKRGVEDLSNEIYQKIGDGNITCFYINDLTFNMVDFQEEGLYCAIQEWLAKYYGFELKPIDVTYDKTKNRYIFDIPNSW